MWKSYPDCPDYQVSDTGAIRRVARWLPRGRNVPYDLRQNSGNSGYLQVSISIDGIPRKVMVHRMVLRTFQGDPPTQAHQGAHLDGDKINNALNNLAWVSAEENAAHKREHGTAFVRRKLTTGDVLAMRAAYRDDDVSYAVLAERFGVSVPTACGVVTGRYWPHVPGAVLSRTKGGKRRDVSARHPDDNMGC